MSFSNWRIKVSWNIFKSPRLSLRFILSISIDNLYICITGSSSLAQSTQAKKLATITAEVESLKVVLEMRTEEIHTLRKENVMLEEKLEEYDTMKIELGKATAQAEDLKAQLNSRLDLER